MLRAFRIAFSLVVAAGSIPTCRAADDVDRDFAAIAAAGPNGEGAAAAREARARLASRGPEIVPKLLAAMDTPNIVAANWCRTLFEDLVERDLKKSPERFPLATFQEYVSDVKRQGRARRLVFDALDEVDPAFRPAFIPTRLHDPEFRDEAVAAVLRQGDEAKKRGEADAARRSYRSAFESARSADQLTQAAARLKDVGESASVIEQMGFVTDWHLLGPFDAPEKTGFARTFPPETKIDLSAKYAGKEEAEIAWAAYHTDDALATTDLIKAIGPVKEAVAYAYAELECDAERRGEVRCSADDNISVWLNGERVFAREQWLNGTRLDRFSAPVILKTGDNKVLVKICQGPRHADTAVPNNWTFQLRFCEPDGRGIATKRRSP